MRRHKPFDPPRTNNLGIQNQTHYSAIEFKRIGEAKRARVGDDIPSIEAQ